MRQLLAIAYPNMISAEQTRLKVLQMQADFLLQLEDIVIAVKQKDGKIKLNQALNLTATGAVQGSFLGMLVGLLFLNPMLGVAVGAASGAVLGALADVGINDEMMRRLADDLNQGEAILFVLAHEITVERVISELEGAGGRVIKTSLSHQDEAALQLALNNSEAFPIVCQPTAPSDSTPVDPLLHPQTVPEAKDEWRNEGNPN